MVTKKSNIKCVEEWTREILSSDQTLFAGYCATRFKLLDTDAQLSSTVLLYTYDIEMISFKTSPLSPFILRTTRTISQCDKVFFFILYSIFQYMYCIVLSERDEIDEGAVVWGECLIKSCAAGWGGKAHVAFPLLGSCHGRYDDTVFNPSLCRVHISCHPPPPRFISTRRCDKWFAYVPDR